MITLIYSSLLVCLYFCNKVYALQATFIRHNKLDRVSNNSIDVSFHLQNNLESFDQNSADKIQSKKDKGIKISPSRVKGGWIVA